MTTLQRLPALDKHLLNDLTFPDPLAAFMFWYRHRLGACLALVIMLVDVSINGCWINGYWAV